MAAATTFPAAGAATPEEGQRSVADLEAAGDAACERGWFTAAREAWGAAASRAASSQLPEAEARLRQRLAMLDRIEAETDAPASPSAAADWPRSWTRRWSAALERGSRSARGVPRVVPLVSRDLVLWNPGSSVHAVSVDDGLPPWGGRLRGAAGGRDADRGDADTAIFPRGLASVGDRAASAPTTVSIAAGRGFAVVVAASSAAVSGPAQALACLDLSAAAEGRLLWLANPPAAAGAIAGPAAASDPVVFDGPPVADFECCAVVVREPSGSPALAAFDARDGRRLWTRPLGRAVPADGIDLGRGCRTPCLAEDLIVVATHAGTVAAFARDGRPAWTTAYAALDRAAVRAAAGPPPPAAPAVFSRGRIFVAPRDRGGVIAFDARTGAILWDASGGAVAVVGTTGRHVVVQAAAGGASDDGAAAAAVVPALAALAADTGRESARKGAGPGERSAGAGRLVGGTLLWPVSTTAVEQPGPRRLAVHVLAGDTLQPLTPPTILPIGDAFPADHDESGDAEPVDLAVGSGTLLVASGRRLHCLVGDAPAAGPRPGDERRPSP